MAPQEPLAGQQQGVAPRTANMPPQEPEQAPDPPTPEEEQERFETTLGEFYRMANIAPHIDENTLTMMGSRVVEEYEIDEKSREDWLEANNEGFRLAKQVRESRTWAGGTVASIKYPMIATAAIQFHARAYPNVIKESSVVRAQVIGSDSEGKKAARGERASRFLNWEVLHNMDGWEEDLDQLLITLPISGCMFKKTYRNIEENKTESELIDPQDLVVNYSAKSLKDAPRVTHILELRGNDIEERVRGGVFLSKELGDPAADEGQDTDDPARPHIFLEQHRWWDLDDDGYQEPYVVTVHRDSRQVVRIAARYEPDEVEVNEDGEVVKIHVVNYFTRYLFMPSFDSRIYGMGFGALLGPINETVNSTINQLLDAGSLANRQGGFLGRGLNIGKGDPSVRLKIGEWRYVNNTGDDLRKGIVPLPVKEPSSTLFNLLSFMIEASRELTSTAEVLSGEQPQANTPASTTLALIEQALKVLNAIYKRLHRCFGEEFQKIRHIAYVHTMEDTYTNVLDDPQASTVDLSSSDFDVVPLSQGADLTDMQRIAKARALFEMMGQGLDDRKVMRRYLEALHIPDVDDLFPDQPQPDPKVELEKQKLAVEESKVDVDRQRANIEKAEALAKIQKMRADAKARKSGMLKDEAIAVESLAKAEAAEVGSQIQDYMSYLDEIDRTLDIQERVIQQNISEKRGGEQGGGNQGNVRRVAKPAGNAGGAQGAQGGSPKPGGETR